MTFYIKPNCAFTNPARWFIGFLAQHLQADLVVTDKDTVEERNPETIGKRVLKITDEMDSDVPIAFEFYQKIEKKNFNHRAHFQNEPLIWASEGQVDYIATIFYMVNCLQEYGAEDSDLDNYNRFKFEASFQAKFGIIRENRVSQLIQKFIESSPILRGIFAGKTNRPSSIFLTHDIDSLYSSFFQDGLWAMKRGRVDVLIQLIINELRRKSAFFNIDKMLKIHTEYGIKSTFFWIAQQGRSADGIKNADYSLTNKRVQQALSNIQKNNFEIGLHKSSLDSNFETEFARLPPNHIPTNRYHFLRFQLPEVWQTMADAGIKLDASLGFADQYGFRNSYGLPFRPYDFRTGTTMPLLVTPLNVMDGTLAGYMGIEETEIARHILDFFEKNKENAVLGLLWHNTEFSEFRYAPYLKIYKEILKYIIESKIKTLTATDIINDF
jgi:hypothetical protein